MLKIWIMSFFYWTKSKSSRSLRPAPAPAPASPPACREGRFASWCDYDKISSSSFMIYDFEYGKQNGEARHRERERRRERKGKGERRANLYWRHWGAHKKALADKWSRGRMSRRTGAGTRYSAKGKGSCCTGCVRQMLKESAGRGSGGGAWHRVWQAQ